MSQVADPGKRALVGDVAVRAASIGCVVGAEQRPLIRPTNHNPLFFQCIQWSSAESASGGYWDVPRNPLSHIGERYYDLSAKFVPNTFYHVYSYNLTILRPLCEG